MHWNIVISDALKFQAKYKKNIISKTEKSLWSLLLYMFLYSTHSSEYPTMQCIQVDLSFPV